jgi:hypothetical protein
MSCGGVFWWKSTCVLILNKKTLNTWTEIIYEMVNCIWRYISKSMSSRHPVEQEKFHHSKHLAFCMRWHNHIFCSCVSSLVLCFASVGLSIFHQKVSFWPIKLVQSSTFHWNTCTNPGKWAVMYLWHFMCTLYCILSMFFNCGEILCV